ncbi:MAG TPA: hypothetical protein PLY23_03960 [Alphaproteobacteria bacterium]|nr:hypothetical protein [Alphaproteobacteria bacterium]HQS93910.1 hypothetical protein [Alphaproteobacteria bacterium]
MSLNEIIMSLELGLIYGIVALGIFLTFRVIDFPDLTCDGSFVLGSAASSMIMKAGYSSFLGLSIAILAGSLAGLTTGVLNTRLRIKDLLAGILVAFMLYSVNLHIMQGMPNITLIGTQTLFTNISPLFILSFLCFLLWPVFGYLFKTDFGLALRSLGQNKKLAENTGVNVKNMTLIGLMLSNGLIALGGALFTQHQGFSDIGSGIGTVIIGLASVMIGERLLPQKSLWIQLLSCLLGSIIYRLFITFALHSDILGLETQDLNLMTGVMLIGIMIIPRRHSC